MGSSTISIPVDEEVARAFQAAPDEQRRAWELMLYLRLRSVTIPTKQNLLQILDRLGKQAQERGLTDEELADMLKKWEDEGRP